MPTYNVQLTVVVEAKDEDAAQRLVVNMVDDAASDVGSVQEIQFDECYAASDDDIEHCDDCGVELEQSQIGLCDGCQSWRASQECDED